MFPGTHPQFLFGHIFFSEKNNTNNDVNSPTQLKSRTMVVRKKRVGVKEKDGNKAEMSIKVPHVNIDIKKQENKKT